MLSAIALEMHRACRDMPIGDYQRWALERLKAHVPFDSALWASGAFNEAGNPVVHNVVLVNRPPEMMEDYEKIKQHDLLARRNVANQGMACLENFVDRNPAWAPAAIAYLHKWRISHALSCITVDPLTRLSTAIALWRDPDAAPYREDERLLFEHTMPHLIETYGTSRIVHLERALHHGRRSARLADAVADRTGHLQVAPPEFLRLLRAEWPRWHGYRLPDALARLLRGRGGASLVGERIAIKATPMSDVFLLQARARHAADMLSGRELEVARLVATGLTRKEAAQRLGIAPATVRNHMSAVFSKLAIGKQSELASALRVLD